MIDISLIGRLERLAAYFRRTSIYGNHDKNAHDIERAAKELELERQRDARRLDGAPTEPGWYVLVSGTGPTVMWVKEIEIDGLVAIEPRGYCRCVGLCEGQWFGPFPEWGGVEMR